MAWWQKKILRYALSRTGLLDDTALDLDKLDITLGKRNVVELKDVGLNIKRISKLAQLPPGLRVETARVLSLRLTVPADVYQSSIVAEVDGVDLSLKLEENEPTSPVKQRKERPRSPVTARSPQHRKVHRRLPSPPPFDPGGSSDDEDAYIPTTEELARSFLKEEPVQERRQLEASVAAGSKDLEESVASSETSDDIGTGGTIGLPGFLASFLQGIVDRLQISVKNVEANVKTEVPGDGQRMVPVTLRLRVGAAELQKARPIGATDGDGLDSRRRMTLQELSLDLLSDADVFTELSELPSNSSPSQSRQVMRSPRLASSVLQSASPVMQRSHTSGAASEKLTSSPKSPDVMRASMMTADSDRFADAGDDNVVQSIQNSQSELDIQPGDDNISWGSRRSKSNPPSEDLWNSMVSEDDLPESLLLERASTQRARSSRGHSPEMQRLQRDQSPLSKVLQSPGSWPRMEDSPPSQLYPQSPGSWPLEQSRQNMFQSMTADLTPELEDATDNKRAALEASAIDGETQESPIDSRTPEVEDLTVSKVFSHEEAESMYMSAMSQSEKMHIPGGWSEGTASERSSSPEDIRHPLPQPTKRNVEVEETSDEDLAYGDRPYSTPDEPRSEINTPRARSPEPAATWQSSSEPKQATKQLLHVDSIVLAVPNEHSEAEREEYQPRPRSSASASFHPHGIPGTFSAYSEMSASRHPGMSFSRAGENTEDPADQRDGSSEPIVIDIGTIRSQVDIPSGRLLYLLAMKAFPLVQPADEVKANNGSAANVHAAQRTSVNVSVTQFNLALKDAIDSGIVSETAEPLAIDGKVRLSCQSIEIATSPGEISLRIGSFRTYLWASCFLSFDRTHQMTTSTIVTEQTPDVALVVASNEGLIKRPSTDITLETLPVAILIDLPIIDYTFDSFGGLSGVLEISNSIFSESGRSSSVSSPPKPQKGVRFEGDQQSISGQSELKFNARFGGASATLQGSACSVRLQASTVKAVHRKQGAVATIEHVRLSGPHISENEMGASIIDLTTMRFDYLLSPQDRDLERLLSLLTPSKDKYDTDDDILIDTLLRQRKKGAVFRASVTSIKLACHDIASLSVLSSFGDELGKLSAVAKYLPDDERPGLLSLVRIKDFEAQVPVNDRFGSLHINVADAHCAHVGLPALLAVSIGNLKSSQSGELELLHPLVPLSGSEALPVIMARMLGGEEEPKIKVKLFNICIEYYVPVVLALTGMDEEASPEEIVAELTKSMADLALPGRRSDEKRTFSQSGSSGNSKTLHLELLIHDTAIGLTPQNPTSKALLVLTDTSLSSRLPAEQQMQASANIRKAGLFVADVVDNTAPEDNIQPRGAPSNSTTKPKLVTALSKQGFVSVGSIMAAKIVARINESAISGTKSVDVDVSNELLLLETCADSTQTLVAILNGLTPPTPPSKQPQYLTEPMTIEDMVASFSGDAFPKPEKPPVTLFDVEEETEDDPDLMIDAPILDEDDDGLLEESTMTSSLYGPIGSLMDGGDKSEDEDTDFEPDTAESFLEEEDPFEMTMTPTDVPLSDTALVKSLNKQYRAATRDESVVLDNYEIEDLGFDALGGNNSILGNAYRFNTPAARRRRAPEANSKPELPFKLRLRDLHIIWNIYDGYDWQRTRDGITKAVEQVEARAEQRKAKRRQSRPEEEDEESVIGDFLFNSIYIGVPSSHDAQELRRQINRGIDDMASETESVPVSGISRPTTVYSASGRPLRQRPPKRLKLERSQAHKVAFELKGVSADVIVFPPDSTDVVSSVDLRVKDFEIFDNVPTSTWRKFLTHLDDPGSRELSKPMMHIELLNVRTLENYAASEIVLHVSVLPLRLHVDQDALDFITRFFEFKDANVSSSSDSTDQPFLQRVEVDTVDMCLDYKPKKVDYAGLRSGHTTEFMNFVILDAANIRLKHAIIYGIKGFEPLHKTLNDVWMPDIKRNQLPTILAGLAPVRSLVNIGTGIRDVVAIPIREYKKDGRIVRSIQKGAFQFGKTTASELARLGAKVALGTQTLLQGTEGFLTPSSASPSGRPSVSRRRSAEQGWQDVGSDEEEREPRALSAYANQPLGVFSGLRSARAHLEHDLLTARDALIAVQGEVLESSTPAGAAAAVVKHAPTVILRPIIGTSRAVGTALLGVGNQIDRGYLRKIDDKYKRR